MEKIDYSINCNLDDEDTNNNCFGCSRFCFPIGCMVGEENDKGRGGESVGGNKDNE